MEDAADSKSAARKGVGVRIPLPVPIHWAMPSCFEAEVVTPSLLVEAGDDPGLEIVDGESAAHGVVGLNSGT